MTSAAGRVFFSPFTNWVRCNLFCPSMNARVNATHLPRWAQWTFEHSVPAERIRSVGTVRPVRTLVGSFRMRYRGKSHKTTKTFLQKCKEGFQSCMCEQRRNRFYNCRNNKHQKGSIKPARGGVHTFTPFRRQIGKPDGEGWGGFQRAEETARFPALWPPSPARHFSPCFEASLFCRKENRTDFQTLLFALKQAYSSGMKTQRISKLSAVCASIDFPRCRRRDTFPCFSKQIIWQKGKSYGFPKHGS